MSEGEPQQIVTLPEAVSAVVALAEDTTALARAAHMETLDQPVLIQTLAVLRHAMWLLGTVDEGIVRHLYLNAEHGEQDVEGVGRVKVYRTRASEKWDERGVARAVIDARMEERGGQLPDDPWDVAEWLLEVVSVGYARKTALRALGIPVEPFYESRPGKPKVDLPTIR